MATSTAQQQSEPRTKKVQNGPHTIAYRLFTRPEVESKLPLIMVMGMTGVKEDWNGLDRELAKDHPVVAFDNRGVGESGLGEPGFSLQDLADDVLFLLDFFGWKKANIFGVSMGGMIAIKAIATAPLRFYKAIIGCSTPGGPESRVSNDFIKAMTSSYKSETDRVKRLYELNLAPAWRATHPAETQALVARSFEFRRPRRGIALQMQATWDLNLIEDLSKVRQPLMLLHGSEDAVIPDKNALLFTMRLKDVRLVRLSGLGHMFWVEDMPTTAAYCRTFLQTPAPAL